MSNAAIYFHPDGYDTTGARLMGRHAAGESFLRGYLRHAQVDRLHLYNAGSQPPADLQPLLSRIEPSDLPVTWLDRRARGRLADPGCLYLPQPTVGAEAWLRRPFGPRRYSLCGITHTTATHRATDLIADLMTAPVEDWDALICTSQAVRSSVEVLLAATREDLSRRLGATRFPTPQLATIPLGVNTLDFQGSPQARADWRRRLDIPQDAVVALYLGRFHAAAKMNPATMALALEATAKATGQTLYWIVAGWAENDAATEAFHAQTRAFCPSIRYLPVDGRVPETRFSLWSAADLFISFSENVQETFGLTPVEAMAAGLPCVVTDWDGYRGTVRHGIDGFRIATTAPRPGLGGDLAYQFASDWISYEGYLAAAAQMTAVDLGAATEALIALVTQADLRASMGRAAQRQAQDQFDWSVIIPRYQDLWTELAARRGAPTRESPPATFDSPRRLDPFTLFESYATGLITSETPLRAAPEMDWGLAKVRLTSSLGSLGSWALMSLAEAEAIWTHLQLVGEAQVSEIVAKHPVHRHAFLERGLLWLVKFGVLEQVRPPQVAGPPAESPN